MNKEDFFEYVVKASVREATDEDYEDPLILSKLEHSAGPLGKDGRPRMLVINAWMVHEGRNDNGQIFIKEELKDKVKEGLFSPPHAGMIDFNHDIVPRGFWYKTSFAFDEKADKWGILTKGAIWAWRFPELTDSILAEQQRSGNVPVSMAAKAESTEITHDFPGAEGKLSIILHNPIFFTTSLLDIPPADVDARAVVTEDPSEDLLPAQRQEELNEAPKASDELPKEENSMSEDLIQELKKQKDEAQDAAKQAKAALSEINAQLAEATAKVARLEVESKQLKTKVSELELALESASGLNRKLENKLEEAEKELIEFRKDKETRERQERLESRLSELPESVLFNLEKHPNKDVLKEAWRESTDEEWETIKESFVLAAKSGPGYTDRQQAGTRLPNGRAAPEGRSKLSEFIIVNE